MKNEELGRARALGFQLLLETHLRLTGKSSIKEFLKDDNFQFGVLTDDQLALLHFYLKDEYSAIGLNLNEEIEKTGEEIIPGKLTNYEMKELIRRSDQLMLTVDIIRKMIETE